MLLAEDDLLSREVACGMLAALGLRVVLAHDGAEAVQRITEGGIDLVLMDVQMPVMDGLSATRAIRAIPGVPRLPIVAMSANTFPEDRRRCLEAGMDAHIPKPVDPGQLCNELARWLPEDIRAASGLSVGGDGRAAPEGLIDVAAGLRCFGGREAAYHRMLQRFAALRAGDAALVRAALVVGDHAQAGRLAHSLKSMAATLGAEALRSASARVEVFATEGDGLALREALDALDEALWAACAAMTAIAGPLPANAHSRSDG